MVSERSCIASPSAGRRKMAASSMLAQPLTSSVCRQRNAGSDEIDVYAIDSERSAAHHHQHQHTNTPSSISTTHYTLQQHTDMYSCCVMTRVHVEQRPLRQLLLIAVVDIQRQE